MEECFVCFNETNKFIIFECGHKMCRLCFPKLRSPLCPVCNVKIKVYNEENYRCCIMNTMCCCLLVIGISYPYM